MPLPLLAIPAIWYPGQEQAEWQAEIDAAWEHAVITREFLLGNIESDSFLDYLAEKHGDPFDVAEQWEVDGCLGNSRILVTGG